MAFKLIAIPFLITCVLVGGGIALYVGGLVGGIAGRRPALSRLHRRTVARRRDDAQQRSDACSQALQTRRLRPEEVALARLTRGVARTMLGSIVASSEDYREALKDYDGAIDPTHPDAACSAAPSPNRVSA
jgi:hypothetical protein